MADKTINQLTAATGITDGSLFVIEQNSTAKSINWGMMKNYISPGVAAQYSTSATYNVGDYVIYNGSLYRCNTAITTGEAWTAAHWTAAIIGDDVSFLANACKEYDAKGWVPVDTAWIRGALSAQGVVQTNVSYRFVTPNIISYSRPIRFHIESGYNVQLATYTSGGVFQSRILIYDGHYLAANTYFRLAVFKVGETTSDDPTDYDRRVSIEGESNAHRLVLNINPSDYNAKLANVTTNLTFNATATQWDDTPFSPSTSAGSGVFTNTVYSANYNVQTYVLINPVTNIWVRITNRNGTVYHDWEQVSGVQPVKVLALGDSICAGARNSGKGFVGDLGVPYKNIAVSGASISNVVTSFTNVPDQLIGETSYEPDIIIAEGGFNDYTHAAALGTAPAAPAKNDTEAAALDRNSIAGAVGYLFYQMIKLHPKAQRFFVIVHKTFNAAANMYHPTYLNAANPAYTMTDVHDILVKMCALYNVKVIDVFNDGIINTLYSAYRSPTAYSDDPTVTDTEYVDSDGIHPLAYGYKQGYVPLVKQAIGIGTVK